MSVRLIFIVPYRDRQQHLDMFLQHMTTHILCDLPPEYYRILIIHQCDTRSFNRGAMKNIGFLAVKQMYPNTYRHITLVFNDVDCMPKTKKILNYETTPGIVKHFYGYKFSLGGIFSIHAGNFELINGFPCFWSWGYEDNMLQNRVHKYKLKIDRSVFFLANDFIIDTAIKNGQIPPNRDSFPIIQHYHGNTRIMNKTDFKKYSNNTENGINSINNLRFEFKNISEICEFENSSVVLINVHSFHVGFDEDIQNKVVYDLQNGNQPFKSFNRQKSASMKLCFT